MSERSLRLKRDTSLELVIAAFNGLSERVDALEAKGEAATTIIGQDGKPLFKGIPVEPHYWDDPQKEAEAAGLRMSLGIKTLTSASTTEPLTPADVRQAVEHAVKETRSGIPDATASWTLHLGPGCVAENTETGNRFTVEPGNAIALNDDVKLAVLDKAEAMIDPRATPKRSIVHDLWPPNHHRTREVIDAVINLQRVLGISADGIVGRSTVDSVKLLAELWRH